MSTIPVIFGASRGAPELDFSIPAGTGIPAESGRISGRISGRNPGRNSGRKSRIYIKFIYNFFLNF